HPAAYLVSDVRPAPLERDQLARLAAAAPLEAERVHPVGVGAAVDRDAARPGFGARQVADLDVLALAGWAAQRGRRGLELADHLRAPRRQVLGELDLDGRELHALGLAVLA